MGFEFDSFFTILCHDHNKKPLVFKISNVICYHSNGEKQLSKNGWIIYEEVIFKCIACLKTKWWYVTIVDNN